MPIYKDQLNRKVDIKKEPKRIVSLVPSQTELLFDLGVGSRITGVTHFCIHPENEVKSKEKVGGTKRLRLDKIDALQPDLIIGNKEENTREDIERLEKNYPVWLSDVNTLQDTYSLFSQLGEILNCKERATELRDQLESDMKEVGHLFDYLKNRKVAYFIWNKPMMVAANHTFINTMLNHLGLTNAFSKMQRYPEIDWSLLEKTKPEIILLSSEPFPFKQKYIEIFRSKLPEAKVELVDGEMFSWYGSRLLQAKKYFEELSAKLK